MRAETQRLLEESARIVDQSVDTTELLEGLDTASNKKSASALDTVVLEEISPGAGANGLFESNSADDISVDTLNLLVCHLALVKACQDLQSLLITVSGSEPAGCLRDDQDDEDHGNQEDALKDCGYAPDETGALSVLEGRKGIVNPVDHHDTW
jgi:hypothetical protein